jgi:isoleucyl-tRNA synthetase
LPVTSGKTLSVHLAEFPEPDPAWDYDADDARWEELLKLREQILIALEGLRKSKQIGSAQEAKVFVATSRPEYWLPDGELLATLCNVSEVEIVADSTATVEAVTAEHASYSKCERCWNYRPTVGQSAEHPTLCERCVRVLAELDGAHASK